MISEETYQIHRIIIYCIVLFFEIFGLFGNLNLIVLTIRKKSLRTKYGYILCTLATIHTLCLLYELVCMGFGVAATFYSYDIRRKTCFLAIFPYVFLNSMQTGTIWVLALNLLITIIFPLKSRKFNVPIYFSFLFFLPVFYGSVTVIFGFIYLEDDAISIIAGITTYSQNAYVCYFRSSEYRTLLSEQISMIHPKLGAMLPKLSAQSSVNGQQWIVSGVSIITTNPLKPQKRAHLK
ncbi:Protein CBR-SRSX-14 [Caenorhabditis briggsae]|uniref:Protein CBR-SRSX-14 n=1 Tax=Caenorhabditis briggsae TaxID=6238 RepID=A8XWQ1_CAEBR|nr:Protein CBR-SRSX-14 [Caenorhabditis briggsae]CAP37070.2 Protein CBR-SRSX-14 [Caenorhabditis briggsae]